MSADLNKVMLIGRLGLDPEIRYAKNDTTIANLSLATSDRWRDKNTGERQEKTQWHRVVIFGKITEIAEKYLKKGMLIYVEGKLETRKWQDKKGEDRYTTEIIVDVSGKIQMLGGRQEHCEKEAPQPQQSDKSNAYEQAKEGWYTPQKPSRARQKSTPLVDFDDDIPF